MRRPFATLAAAGSLLVAGLALISLLPFSTPPPQTSSLRPVTGSTGRPLEMRELKAIVLLVNAPVQDELRMSDEQRAAADLLARRFLDGLKPLAKEGIGLTRLSREEQNAQIAALNARQAALASQSDREALGILSAAQRARLAQVGLQLSGEEAFYLPEIVAALRLTSSQLEEIMQLRLNLLSEVADLRSRKRAGKLSAEETDVLISNRRRETYSNYRTLLTDDQRRTWYKLAGDDIPFSRDELSWRLGGRESHHLAVD
jgi:hypothetical protein